MTAATVLAERSAGPARTPTAIPAEARARIVTPADAGRLWPDLAAEAVEDNVFFDPAFLTPAAAALGIAPLLLAVAGPGGRAIAFLPLRRGRLGRVAPALEGVAHQYGPLGTPILSRRDPVAAAEGLVAAALEHAGPRSALLLPLLPEASPVTAAIAAAAADLGRSVVRRDRHARAMLEREADGIDPRLTLPQRRRKEYARQLRRLGDEGATSVASVTSPGAVAAAFDAYVALESAGWKGRRGTAFAHRPAFRAFAREAVVALAERGACRILTLQAGERAAAMLICFTAGHTATTWKIAYDEDLARFSPGAQLMLEAPPLLFADPAIRQIDSCATPNHPMIDHLWRGRLALTTLVIAPERGRLRYAAGLRLDRAEQRARHWARNLRRGAAPRPQHDQG